MRIMKIFSLCAAGIFLCSFWGCFRKEEKTIETPKVEPQGPISDEIVSKPGVTDQEASMPDEMMPKSEILKQKTPSGLEWEVLETGDGEFPKEGQKAVVHYTGWLNKNGAPGQKFDSSIDRGQEFIFPVGKGLVIKGWDEAIVKMRKGEKVRLYIPAVLAYGERGVEGVIPPNANLIFDVALIDIR